MVVREGGKWFEKILYRIALVVCIRFDGCRAYRNRN